VEEKDTCLTQSRKCEVIGYEAETPLCLILFAYCLEFARTPLVLYDSDLGACELSEDNNCV
jgi:hypothetical protein